jgi:arabinan endo-1,5-alpha-L-arabinosidase
VSGNDRYPGTGHCAVVQKDGRDVMLFHAYDRDFGYESRLLVRPLDWTEEGWPKIQL